MAILIDFQKVREDSQEVEYQYGLDQMDRRLVIHKESREGRPVDGTTDRHFHRVMWKILQYLETLQRWPEKGSYQA